jgi:phage gpG-like protein
VYSFQILWAANQPERLARDLFGLAAGVREGRRGLLHRAVDEIVRPSIAHNFEVDGRPDPWPELAESTMERRERAGYTPDDPLTASGAGKRSATAKARWRITRERAEYRGDSFPSSTWTMSLHNVGESEGHFPARPFAVVQPEDADALGRLAGDWFDRKRRRAGF